METALEMRLRGHHYIGVLKTNSYGYPKAFLEMKMKYYPAGSYLVLEKCTKEEIDLLAIGYKYNRKKIMFFISTKSAGHAEEGGNHIRQDGKIRIMTLVWERFPSILSRAIILTPIIKRYSLRSQVREVLVDTL